MQVRVVFQQLLCIVFTLVPDGVGYLIYKLLHFSSVFKGLNLAIHCDFGAGWGKCVEFRLLEFVLPCNI